MNVSHSHVRTKKRSHPNLHNFKLKTAGVTKRLRLCTKCLRTVKKTATAETQKGTEAQKAVTTEAQKDAEPQKEPKPVALPA
jgi:large subunit ribosomal protein L28